VPSARDGLLRNEIGAFGTKWVSASPHEMGAFSARGVASQRDGLLRNEMGGFVVQAGGGIKIQPGYGMPLFHLF